MRKFFVDASSSKHPVYHGNIILNFGTEENYVCQNFLANVLFVQSKILLCTMQIPVGEILENVIASGVLRRTFSK